MKVIPETYFAR